jgi:hypothetical protein
MNPSKPDAIASLRPGAEWVLRGDDLEWLDQTETEPTEAEIQAELARLIAEQPCMSTIKVSNIQNASTSSGGIAIDTSGHVTVDGVAMPSSGPLSNRNLIINGAMQVAQRGTQVTGVSISGYHTVDRFKIAVNNLGTWTSDQATDAPAGFTKSFKATCTTADASPAAGDSALMVYQPEAQDLQLLDFGASGAKSTTLSFWVKSNKTGTATFAVLQLQ